MAFDPKEPAPPLAKILLFGPLRKCSARGVVDAAHRQPRMAQSSRPARRPVPSHRDSTAVRHLYVDLLDREGHEGGAFPSWTRLTDLVFAAYVEMPTMAETVEPNTRGCSTTTLERARCPATSPLRRRSSSSGGAKSLRVPPRLVSNGPGEGVANPRLIAPIHYHQQEDILKAWSEKTGTGWDRPASPPGHGSEPELADEPRDRRCHVRRDEPGNSAYRCGISRPARKGGTLSRRRPTRNSSGEPRLWGARIGQGEGRDLQRLERRRVPMGRPTFGANWPSSTRFRSRNPWPCRPPRRWPRRGRCGIPWVARYGLLPDGPYEQVANLALRGLHAELPPRRRS